ncbi:MAG: hypothetical protein ACRDF6_09640 [bacterium]
MSPRQVLPMIVDQWDALVDAIERVPDAGRAVRNPCLHDSNAVDRVAIW